MSIEVNNLTKLYGNQRVLDNISFSVEENEIVGFLGPNGAGKSTTMKIATGYIRANSGSVLIDGFDVNLSPVAVRSRIGYLPEHNPLYTDMFVHEFLHFCGSFYKLSKVEIKTRIKLVIEVCGLGDEQNKIIGQLSKGYRQRVGIAQALLHDPAVLILDEPTTGLDPNQLVEVRNLIKEVSQHKTVIFSTHIMQEVEAICERAIVINQGKIVADDKISALQLGGASFVVDIEFSMPVDIQKLSDLKGVSTIKTLTENTFELTLNSKEDIRPYLMTEITNRNLPLIGMNLKTSSMQEVFADLTTSNKNV